jgi:hypothetical protein
MIDLNSNLMIVGKETGYGYSTYYIGRKDETENYPSDYNLAKSISYFVGENQGDDIQYEVVDKVLQIQKRVKGELMSSLSVGLGYLNTIELYNGIVVNVLTKSLPKKDSDNMVNVFGETSLKVKVVKIYSRFKCKIKLTNRYTYTKSRSYYTKCKNNNSMCSSKSNAIVPSAYVCGMMQNV